MEPSCHGGAYVLLAKGPWVKLQPKIKRKFPTSDPTKPLPVRANNTGLDPIQYVPQISMLQDDLV